MDMNGNKWGDEDDSDDNDSDENDSEDVSEECATALLVPMCPNTAILGVVHCALIPPYNVLCTEHCFCVPPLVADVASTKAAALFDPARAFHTLKI